MTSATTPGRRFGRLRAFNVAMGVVHAAQGVAVLVLSTDFSLPVTATFLQGPPGVDPPVLTEWFDVRLGPAVAAFLFISAAAHWLIASPGIYGWYLANLDRGRNYARWIEYSLSASLMMVLIAMLSGVSDAAALVALFGVNASMILFGLLMEHTERPGEASWLSFWFGSIAGIVPWIAIGIYFVSPGTEATPPGFVVAIFVSLFLFFNSFALNMALQYGRVGPWRDYLFGERAYIVLSLTSKSALAWQVFAGTLAG
jgi:Heliorhodopsin